MKAPFRIEKRCQACGNVYPLPNLRECRARDLILQLFPCPACVTIDDGRCIDESCLIPFRVRPHHAKGRCLRCYNRLLRYENRIA